MAINFTKEQQQIIDSRGKNILVSASAGSGKTTVMIQRIIDLVLDKNNPTPISNFLVVTFTKASASDMKKKLIDSFLEHQDNDFVLEQIDDVETSDISNLHSFCSKLISTYFYEVGVDPAFKVLDETSSRYLQEKAFIKLFEKKEREFDQEYLMIFDIFQKNRKNSALKDIISKINDFLNANLNAFSWIDEMIEKIYDVDLNSNPCAKMLNNYVCYQMQDLIKKVNLMADECLNFGLDKVNAYFVDIASSLAAVNLKNTYEVNAKNLFEIELPKAPTVKQDVILKSKIDEVKKLIKDQLTNFKSNLISDDSEFLKQGLIQSKTTAVGLIKLVKEFNEIYAELKKEYNGLDFNDLEKYALKILENNRILEALKNKYKYIFVDEYQDINSVQEKIIGLLSGKNNRFMVGDVKQSIYRFRYCDPEIFLKYYAEYSLNNENSELHKLNCNFRSDKKILKFVDSVFADVMTKDFGGIDYKSDSMFIAGENNLDNPKSVILSFIDTTKAKQKNEIPKGVYSVKNHVQFEVEEDEVAIAEAKYVADKIAKLIEEKGMDFLFEQVAILVGARNAMVEKFIERLKSFDIPVSADEKFNLMDKTYIKEIINFVKYVCCRNDDILAFKVLKSRLFGFSDDELSQVRMLNLRVRFYECLTLFDNVEDEHLKVKLSLFNEKVNRFSKLARIMSLKDLIRKIVEDFDLLQINDASEYYLSAEQDISKLIELLPNTDAFDFVVNYENFSLEMESEGNSQGCVQIMTIHKSKGIEFKYVFLINTTSEFNFKSNFSSVVFNKEFGLGVDYFDVQNRTQIESIASEGIKFIEKRKLVEEKQRVLYVALTRAIEKLYIVCSKPEEKIKDVIKDRKTSFCDWFDPILYNELYGKHNELLEFEKYTLQELYEKPQKEINALHFYDEDTDEPKWFDYKFSKFVNVQMKTSVSKILSGREKIETSHSNKMKGVSSAERGSAYHKLLEQIDFKQKHFEMQVDEIFEKLNDEYKKLINKRDIVKLLNNPIFEKISNANRIFTEREFYYKLPVEETLQNDDFCLLQGIVDLIAIYDDGFIILDYKTGKFNETKLSDYEFQINTYAKVIEKSFNLKPLKKIICFVDEQKIIEI